MKHEADYPEYVSISIDKDKPYARLYRGVLNIIETHGLSDTTCQTLYGVSEFLENIENREDGFFCITLADITELENILEEIEISDDDEKRFEIPSERDDTSNNTYYHHAHNISINAYDYYRSEIREDLLSGNLSATTHDIQNLAEHLDLSLMVFDQKMGNARDYLNEKAEENPDGFNFEQVEEDDYNFIQRSGIANVAGIHNAEPRKFPVKPSSPTHKRKNHLRSVK